MNQLPVTVLYHKLGAKLEPLNKLDTTREDLFIKSLKEGERVEVTFQVFDPDHSRAQNDKVHKCIREIAKDTGNSLETIKEIIKVKMQYTDASGKFRSFADASREELSLAIQTCIELGDSLGINLH